MAWFLGLLAVLAVALLVLLFLRVRERVERELELERRLPRPGAGKCVPKSQAPGLSRAERRRYAKLYRKLYG